MCRRKGGSVGDKETATAGKAGRETVSPSLDFSDGGRGSREGSPEGGLFSDMHGSGSAGIGSFWRVTHTG